MDVAQVARAGLGPSAHADTFCRDSLPPAATSGRTCCFDLPELHYPGRLNCADELLDGHRPTADRRCLLGPGGAVDVRRAAGARRPVAARAGRGPRPGPGQPGAAARPEQPLAGRLLARRAEGRRRRRSRRCRCSAPRRAAVDRATSPSPTWRSATPGSSTTSRRRAYPGCGSSTYGGDGADDLLDARGPAPDAVPTPSPPRPTTSRCSPSPRARPASRRRRCTSTATCSPSPTPSRAHVLAADAGRPLRRQPAARLHLRARRPAWSSRCAPAPSTLLLEQADRRTSSPAPSAEHGVTVLFTAPTAYRAMLAARRRVDLRALRRCVSAGEPLPRSTWQAFHEATGLRIIDGIGATEMLHIFISAADDDIRPGSDRPAGPRLRGARCSTTTAAPVPDGEPGRLAVRGPTGCRYLADDRAASLRAARLEHHRRHLPSATPTATSGTMARSDDMIISAGYNIAGPEVENALLRHPDVVECGGRRRSRTRIAARRHGVRGAAARRHRRRGRAAAELQELRQAGRSRRTSARGSIEFLPRCRTPRPASCSASSCASWRRADADCASRSSAAGPAGLYFAAAGASSSARRTRSRCGSATPRTTRSASGWCSPTRRSAASSTPTRWSTGRWSASSPAGTTSTSTSDPGTGARR